MFQDNSLASVPTSRPFQGPENLYWMEESLGWLPSATGVEELLLWRLAGPFAFRSKGPRHDISVVSKWLDLAAALPRLRLVELGVSGEWLDLAAALPALPLEELWESGQCEGPPQPHVLRRAVRAEGESVEALLQRLLWDVAKTYCALDV